MYKLSDIAGEVEENCASCVVTYEVSKPTQSKRILLPADLCTGEIRSDRWSKDKGKWEKLLFIERPDGLSAAIDKQEGVITSDNALFPWFEEELKNIIKPISLKDAAGRICLCYYG